MFRPAAGVPTRAITAPEQESVPVVLDPVMIAESGARLLESEARDALIELLLPRATVATPNIPEARSLLDPDQAGPAEDDAAALARAVHRLGPRDRDCHRRSS